MSYYETIVGNIGTVYSGESRHDAINAYSEYRGQSRSGYGRAAYEDVVVMKDGDIIFEHRVRHSS